MAKQNVSDRNASITARCLELVSTKRRVIKQRVLEIIPTTLGLNRNIMIAVLLEAEFGTRAVARWAAAQHA